MPPFSLNNSNTSPFYCQIMPQSHLVKRQKHPQKPISPFFFITPLLHLTYTFPTSHDMIYTHMTYTTIYHTIHITCTTTCHMTHGLCMHMKYPVCACDVCVSCTCTHTRKSDLLILLSALCVVSINYNKYGHNAQK